MGMQVVGPKRCSNGRYAARPTYNAKVSPAIASKVAPNEAPTSTVKWSAVASLLCDATEMN